MHNATYEEYQRLFNLSQDIVCIVDFDGYIISVNAAFSKILGYELDELTSRKFIEFVHPDDRAVSWKEFEELTAGRPINYLENRYLAKDGHVGWLAWKGTPDLENKRLYGIAREITEQKKIEENLRRSEERYRTLASLTPVGIFHTDAEGHDLYVNQRACEIMGLSFVETEGVGWEQSLHPYDSEHVRQEWYHAVKHHKIFNLEYRFKHRDGKVVWVSTEGVPVRNERGDVTGYVGAITDITKLREVEAQNRAHQRQLSESHHTVNLSELTAILVHEISQPLHIMQTYVQACLYRLQHEEVPVIDQITNSLIHIDQQVKRADDVVKRIKSFVADEAFETLQVDLNVIIRSALDAIDHDDFLHTQIEFDLLEPGPQVKLNRIRVEQVILNLVHNAIEAMQRAHTSDPKVTIRTRVVEDDILITVSDNGPGVPDDLKDVFAPFVSSKQQGLGMGLPIGRSLLRSHGGELSLLSTGPEGSQFQIKLPQRVSVVA